MNKNGGGRKGSWKKVRPGIWEANVEGRSVREKKKNFKEKKEKN